MRLLLYCQICLISCCLLNYPAVADTRHGVPHFAYHNARELTDKSVNKPPRYPQDRHSILRLSQQSPRVKPPYIDPDSPDLSHALTQANSQNGLVDEIDDEDESGNSTTNNPNTTIGKSQPKPPGPPEHPETAANRPDIERPEIERPEVERPEFERPEFERPDHGRPDDLPEPPGRGRGRGH